MTLESQRRLARARKRVLLDDSQLDELFKDVQNGEAKAVICAKYGMAPADYKLIKKYVMGKLK